jgi:hypothetical protein
VLSQKAKAKRVLSEETKQKRRETLAKARAKKSEMASKLREDMEKQIENEQQLELNKLKSKQNIIVKKEARRRVLKKIVTPVSESEESESESELEEVPKSNAPVHQKQSYSSQPNLGFRIGY